MKDTGKKIRYAVKKSVPALILAAAMTVSGALNAAAGTGISAKAAPIGQMKLAKSYLDDIEDAEKAKEELEKKKREEQETLKQLEKEKTDILNYVEKLDIQLNEMYQELEEIQNEIDTTTQDLEETRVKLAEAKQTEADQYETMKRRIQYMYENGGSNDLLEAILTSTSISDALNQIEYSMMITEYDNSLLERYQATRKLVEETEISLTAKLDKLNTKQEELEVQLNNIQALVDEKAKELQLYMEKIGVSEETLFDYADQIDQADMSIEDLKKKQKELEEEEERKRKEEEERQRKLIEERKRQEEERKRQEEANKNQGGSSSSAGSSSTGSGSGNTTAGGATSDASNIENMIWPLPGRSRISSPFGPRKAPIAGASTYHKGIDISGNTGDEIIAALAGTVVVSQYSVSSGNWIQIDHGNGLRTSYLHCSKLLVSVGDKVKQGEVIGLVGSTGISTGSHLHFSVIIDGVNVNPVNYVSP